MDGLRVRAREPLQGALSADDEGESVTAKTTLPKHFIRMDLARIHLQVGFPKTTDDAGRVTYQAARLRHPKGRGSRTITPQVDISENDSTHALIRQ